MRSSVLAAITLSLIVSACGYNAHKKSTQQIIQEAERMSQEFKERDREMARNIESRIRPIAIEIAEKTGVVYNKNGQEYTINASINTVKGSLKDPDTAKFKDLRVVDYSNGKLVCGEVNAKNSFGGYTGFKPFAAGVSGWIPYEGDEDNPILRRAYNVGIHEPCGL